MDATQIEQRRMNILAVLDQIHPLAIFTDLQMDDSLAFTLSQASLFAIRRGLSQSQRRRNESVALGTVKIAGQTEDRSNLLYEMTHFKFMNIGGRDSVYGIDSEVLQPGEIEIHTHLPSAPDYLGQTDVGDLIAAIEGPAFVHPTTKMIQPHLRIYGILSVKRNRTARLDFYSHNLLDALIPANNFGLHRAAYPVMIPNAY